MPRVGLRVRFAPQQPPRPSRGAVARSWIVLTAATIGAHVDVNKTFDRAIRTAEEAIGDGYTKDKAVIELRFGFSYFIAIVFGGLLCVITFALAWRGTRGISATRRLGEPLLLLLIAWTSMTLQSDVAAVRCRVERGRQPRTDSTRQSSSIRLPPACAPMSCKWHMAFGVRTRWPRADSTASGCYSCAPTTRAPPSPRSSTRGSVVW